MSETLTRLNQFIADWRASLETNAAVFFEARTLGSLESAPPQIADRFVCECGFTPIGVHWEMLAPEASPYEPRSARGAFKDALAMDLVMKSKWLGDARALECGEQFLRAFDPAWATIVTNHIVRAQGMSEAWNPISDWTLEWAFVGFDREAIALLLVMAED